MSYYELEKFSKEWLESTVFNTKLANELLSKNKMIQLLFEVEKLKGKPLSEKEDFLEKTMTSDAYFTVKEAIINQLKN